MGSMRTVGSQLDVSRHGDIVSDRFADLIMLPSLHIEGIVYGSPYVELNKSSTIISSTGYIATIDYSGKGWISGKKNSFTATLTKEGSKEVLYTIDGQWTDKFVVKEGKTKNEVRDPISLLGGCIILTVICDSWSRTMPKPPRPRPCTSHRLRNKILSSPAARGRRYRMQFAEAIWKPRE